MLIEQSPVGAAAERLPSERIAVLATGAAFFMIVLDTSIVNLALPPIGAELASNLVGLRLCTGLCKPVTWRRITG
jgi:hypothetical protein